MKRPNEIEEAIDAIDNAAFDFSNTAVLEWNKLIKYIEQLENTIQELAEENERLSDDGK